MDDEKGVEPDLMHSETTEFTTLRSRIHRLQRLRAFVRVASVVCSTVANGLWLLVGLFLCDWIFSLSAVPRGCLIFAIVSLSTWSFARISRTLSSQWESVEAVALIVEQQHQIDGLFIAALQFETTKSFRWGSPQLAAAVVSDAAERAASLDILQGFDLRPLLQRGALLAVAILVVGTSSRIWPAHAATFWNHLHLGTAQYPTRTQWDSISIDGQIISPTDSDELRRIRVPYGRVLAVVVRCRGEIPAAAFAQLSNPRDNSRSRVHLEPVTNQPATFQGELIHMTESFQIHLHAGDASLPVVEVEIVPLPLVDIDWRITPPEYASASYQVEPAAPGVRQLSSLEGSSAGLQLTCSNKTLRSAQLSTNGKTYELRPSSKNGDGSVTWSLPSHTPFERLQESLKYEIQVIDEDQLSLERPLLGQIRLKPDRRPLVTTSAVTQKVLPTAQPKIDYSTNDDFGIAQIIALVEVIHHDGRRSEHEVAVTTIPTEQQPANLLRGQITIPLSSYELLKGDEIKVVLRVTDWRGEIAGLATSSLPLSFEVTDLNGILHQANEQDKKTAKQFDEILKRERSTGAEKK